MHFLDPVSIIQTAGIIGVIAVVFAETGILLGIFFPGDSLLFAAGLFASKGFFNIYILLIGSIIAAVLGDTVSYWIGRKIGPKIFVREDSFFFKKRYIEMTKEFYDIHGARALVLARFVPIVRTIAPLLAGVGEMPYYTFFSYNVFGGILWASIASLAGYFIGSVVPDSVHYITYIALAIIVVSFIPAILEYMRNVTEERASAHKDSKK